MPSLSLMSDDHIQVSNDDDVVVIRAPREMDGQDADAILSIVWDCYETAPSRPIIFDISVTLMSDHFLRVIREAQAAKKDVLFGVSYGIETLAKRLFEETSFGETVPGARTVGQIHERLLSNDG